VTLLVVVAMLSPAAAPAAGRPTDVAPVAATTSVTTPAATTDTRPPSTSVATTSPATSATTRTTPPQNTSPTPTTGFTRSPPSSDSSPFSTSTDASTTLPATTTTVAALGGPLSVPPSTLPLSFKQQSGHVSPLFAQLSGAGFVSVALLMATQAVLTRKRRAGRRTL